MLYVNRAILSERFAEPNCFQVKDSMSAHLKQENTLTQIRGRIQLDSRLFVEADDTAQKTMQLSRITDEEAQDHTIISVYTNDEMSHFELSYLIISDNARCVGVNILCEFFVLCYLTNPGLMPTWLHHRMGSYPYYRIAFTVLGDSQYYGNPTRRQQLCSWMFCWSQWSRALYLAKHFDLKDDIKRSKGTTAFGANYPERLPEYVEPVTPPASMDSRARSESDIVSRLYAADEALAVDRLAQFVEEKEQELAEESDIENDVRNHLEDAPRVVMIIDDDFRDMIGFVSGSILGGRLELGLESQLPAQLNSSAQGASDNSDDTV